MAKSTSKRQKPTVMDRISNLSDSLLCHILWFLTTKEAVITSILSSRWKTLWTLVPKLDFDSHEFERISPSDEEQSLNQHYRQDYRNNRDRFTFTHIVTRAWAIRNLNNVNPLKHFRLHWDSNDFDPIHAETWVRAALTPDLEVLDLLIGFSRRFNFPSTLFNYAKSLVVLKLKEGIVVNPPSSSLGFPTLKTLLLHSVRYSYGDTFSELLSCCPVLQNLHLQTYIRNYDNNFKIIVPTLKTLHLILFLQRDYRLEINAPALKYLHFRAFIMEGRPLRNKSLHLDPYFTERLCYATELDLPMFHNLAFLYFKAGACLWHVLPHLLHRAPNLAVLVFEKEYDESYDCDEEDTSIIKRMFNEDVPICISSHLKTFHFKGFKGLTYELEFVGLILKTARFLKTMTVSSADIDSMEQFRVLKELLMLPRESRTCQIAFN
ncbi:FBD-associated F-box protein At3g52670-like [Castanea sativa]|uniref:FBD-associated F-box protein At3g52670-like n=1 Tax=Castanea sativa TaxID=21020 RepID=UPI003F6525E1